MRLFAARETHIRTSFAHNVYNQNVRSDIMNIYHLELIQFPQRRHLPVVRGQRTRYCRFALKMVLAWLRTLVWFSVDLLLTLCFTLSSAYRCQIFTMLSSFFFHLFYCEIFTRCLLFFFFPSDKLALSLTLAIYSREK